MNSEMEASKILAFAALILSVRVLTWTALLAGIGLFTYAVLYPSDPRTLAAALFALLVFLPALWSEKKPKPPRAPQQHFNREDEAA